MRKSLFPAYRDIQGKLHNPPVICRLITQNNGKIHQFKDLPTEAQLAIAHYMGIDGEAWDFTQFNLFDGLENPHTDDGFNQDLCEANCREMVERLTKNLPQIIQQKGHTEYGFVTIPTPQLQAAWVEIAQNNPDYANYKTFDDYHEWYQPNQNHVEKPTWPVILASFGDELLQDGWHRFHQYVELACPEIPAVWYPHIGKVAYDCPSYAPEV